MRNGSSTERPRKSWHLPAGVAAVVLALVGVAGPASARQYGAGDISSLVSLWNTNRTAFKGTVQGIDTFSAIGTVDEISPSGVVVEVGLSAEVSCPTAAPDVAKGDKVSVSGRIDSAATAVSQGKKDNIGTSEAGTRARDALGLQSCTVQKLPGAPK